MRIVVKAVLCLLVIGGIGVIGYAVFSDLPAPSRQVEQTVTAK
jgi:hypothetical protein